jgi:hypothetical protein
MFHFPAFPPTPYEFEMQVTRHDSRQVPPFGHPGITARLTAPPGLSQPPTSFIGPWYQGIHRPPLPTYPTHTYQERTTEHQNARVHYANLNPPPTHNHPDNTRRRHSHAWPRDQPPVVLSEPQQGVRLAAGPDPTGRLFPHPPRHPPPTKGSRSTRRAVLDPTRPPPDPTRQCLHPRAPRPDIRGP